MQNFLTLIEGPFKGVIGLINIQQNKKVFSKINS